jgi:hypothetical protein
VWVRDGVAMQPQDMAPVHRVRFERGGYEAVCTGGGAVMFGHEGRVFVSRNLLADWSRSARAEVCERQYNWPWVPEEGERQ